MRILICGGHLTPALAVIEALPKDAEILYVGRKYALEGDTAHSLEYSVITQRQIPFAHINAGRLQRKLTKFTIPSLLKLPKGMLEALHIVKEFRPDVVVGFGGYVSVPLGTAAYLLKIPLIIHEQTLACGLANKLLSRIATIICLSWETSKKYFPKEKCVVTGNPAVTTIFKQAKKRLPKKTSLPLLVIVGGSLGSHVINTLVEGVLEKLLEQVEIIHQTGDAKEFSDFVRLEEKKKILSKHLQERYTITKFIDPTEIVGTLEEADVVVTRAGVNTITTLLLLQKPSFVIPLPSSGKNDQHKNAVFFAEHGLGIVGNQQELTPDRFFKLVSDMIKQKEKFTNKKDTKELLIHKTATQQIVNCILFYANAQKTNYQKKSTNFS